MSAEATRNTGHVPVERVRWAFEAKHCLEMLKRGLNFGGSLLLQLFYQVLSVKVGIILAVNDRRHEMSVQNQRPE